VNPNFLGWLKGGQRLDIGAIAPSLQCSSARDIVSSDLIDGWSYRRFFRMKTDQSTLDDILRMSL